MIIGKRIAFDESRLDYDEWDDVTLVIFHRFGTARLGYLVSV